ncbi:hypothetical protein [Polaromonas sp. CG9_12]|nr:hypothetical protein [Polaromonas sp. CG9_12]
MVNNLSQATSPQGRVNTPEDNAMGVAAQAEIDRRAAARRRTPDPHRPHQRPRSHGRRPAL